jgi:hypothetical protein
MGEAANQAMIGGESEHVAGVNSCPTSMTEVLSESSVDPSGAGISPSGKSGAKAQGDRNPVAVQEFYWKRQAERAQKEMEAIKRANETEMNLLKVEREEAQARLKAAEEKAARLAAIAEAGLPAELAQLVPEAEAEKVQEYVEKLKPLAEKFRRPGPAGTVTNPARSAGGDGAQLTRLAASAGRGDRKALREYAHLREKMRGNR